MGYDIKVVIHDDVRKQSKLFDAAIICDNTSSNAPVIPTKKALDAGIPTFMIDRELRKRTVQFRRSSPTNARTQKISLKFSSN